MSICGESVPGKSGNLFAVKRLCRKRRRVDALSIPQFGFIIVYN